MKHVVVIGCGFAGLTALNQLVKSKQVKLTLISKESCFLFTPRLTELLNNSVKEKYAIKSVSEVFGNGIRNRIKFIKDKAIYINLEKNYVKTAKKAMGYDFLIMSQGAATNFFGNKTIEDNAIGYKDYKAVLKIKNTIKKSLQMAAKPELQKIRKELLTFAVIGAGLTGIELVCSLKEFVAEEIKNYPLIGEKAKFMLINSSKDIAEQLNVSVRRKIEKYLKKNGIEVILDTKAEDIKKNGINEINGMVKEIITSKGRIKASAIIWTAGIKANIIETYPKLPLEKNNAIKVTSKLKIPSYENAYVGGDAALFIENNKALPQTAQVALHQGNHIGKNILRSIKGKKEKDFYYAYKGTLIVLGKKYGIFAHNKLVFGGKIAWHFRNIFYLYRFWKMTR
ncbi:FAD-dependent oxidoreductase [Candidatus Woesearchaeota archaeon]|nr:FAD-dependent oxidoreductase [Candidatus Woesearchaeota archaeon]